MSVVPTNLKTVIIDFTTDLSTVYPEYAFLWSNWNSTDDTEYEKLFKHCLAVFPERFFDIMYTNADIFKPESKLNVTFLPNVDFRLLFNCDGISENTKTSIWKYLQLILMTVLGSVKDAADFGDAADIFSAMNEKDLQEKMAETMDGINKFFTSKDATSEAATSEAATSEAATSEAATSEAENDFKFDETHFKETMDGMKEAFETAFKSEGEGEGEGETFGGFKFPKPEVLHEHLKGLLDGKLGKLAKEFTEEFTEDMKGVFDEGDMNDVKSSKDILMKIIKNPQKMMLIMKKLTDKLQAKMKSGDISQEEMMDEMQDLMEKMKGMGGKGDLADLMKSLSGTPMMKMLEKGLGGKVDMSAFGKMTKQNALKERLRNKMQMKQMMKQMNDIETKPKISPATVMVKIGDEVQEKSGLKPMSSHANAQALSESELIKLFENDNKKLNGKKLKDKKSSNKK
jgi:hypothetical protein